MRLRALGRLLQIQASAKRFSSSAQNQDALLGVSRGAFDRGGQVAHQLNRERIAALRPVERDESNLRCLFFDENDWHDLSYAVSNTRHDGIRQAHRMSARRLAGDAAPNTRRPKGGIFARLGGGGFPAYRRGELRLTQ